MLAQDYMNLFKRVHCESIVYDLIKDILVREPTILLAMYGEQERESRLLCWKCIVSEREPIVLLTMHGFGKSYCCELVLIPLSRVCISI